MNSPIGSTHWVHQFHKLTSQLTLTLRLSSDLKPDDKDRRFLVEVWDWDRTSRDDFMGSLSFGISELIKDGAEGWFKLLGEEEGEFYNVPVTEGTDTELFRKQIKVTQSPPSSPLRPIRLPSWLNQSIAQQAKASVVVKKPIAPTEIAREVPHNMSRKDIIRNTDFHYLMVLGKGSFGKVTSSIDPWVHESINPSIECKNCNTQYEYWWTVDRYHSLFEIHLITG